MLANQPKCGPQKPGGLTAQRTSSTAYGGAHLRGRSATDVVACGHRSFQGQHVEHVLFDDVRELSQLVEAHFRQILAAFDAVGHGLAHYFMSIAEGSSFAYQIVDRKS